jgi:outer membrane receptor for ferrienterochelin and colicins
MRRLAGILLLLCTTPAAAQQVGRFEGTVVDRTTNRPVAAQVRVRDSAGVATHARTDRDGRFRTDPLSIGFYTIEIRALGYRSASVERRLDATVSRLDTVALGAAAIELDALVVTASRREQRLADVPVPTEIISRRDIESSGAADLAQVLLDQTGIQVQGGIASGTGVLLQGLGDERILVLVDGQPVVGRIGGQLDLARLPVASVERIEIVRGPQSTLYGSDAMGGVINIITRNLPSEPVVAELSTVGGSEGRREATFRMGASSGGWRVSIDGGRREADLVAGRTDSADATQSNWDGLLKAELLAGAWRVTAGVQAVDEDQRWRTGQLWYSNDNFQWNARSGVRYQSGMHELSLSVYGTEYRHHSRRSNSPTPPDSIGERETQGLAELELEYGLTAGPHAVDAGVELTRENIDSDRVLDRHVAQLAGESFAQYTINLGAWSLVTGARASISDRWGTAFTPRAALQWRPVEPVALRAGVGTGYRAPDFKETRIEFLNIGPGFGYVVRGNPDLDPENSRNVTLGVEVTPGSWFVRAQGFYTRFTDFIESVAQPDSGGLQVFTYSNRAAGRTAGIETEAAAVVGPFRFEGGYSWLHTQDDETAGPLLGRPTHSARGGVNWTSSFGMHTRLGAVFTGSAPIQRSEDGTAVYRDGYTRVDVRAGWRMLRSVQLVIGVENLFEARPQGWPGFTGRRLYAGATWRPTGL